MPLPSSPLLAARHARVRSWMAASGLDAFVVTSATNIRYLANHIGSAGVLVLTGDAAHLLVDFRYTEAVTRLQQSPAACPDLIVGAVPASYDGALVQCLVEIGAGAVGFEAEHVSVARRDAWQRLVHERSLTLDFRAANRVVEALRIIKDESEVAALRAAAVALTPVAAAALATARAGVRERVVAAAIESALRDAGFDRPAFDTIVASGPHAALPHHRAGDRILAPGDLVVLDFGGVLDGYCSDLTRTVSIGPPSDAAHRLYASVFEAQTAAIAAVRPGIETAAVDGAARAVLRERGLGDAFGHGTGHGLGLEVHEEPRVTWPRADVASIRLEPGMVLTVEPGAYLPGFGGVRIEDDVLVTETGCEVLTQVSRELRVL